MIIVITEKLYMLDRLSHVLSQTKKKLTQPTKRNDDESYKKIISPILQLCFLSFLYYFHNCATLLSLDLLSVSVCRYQTAPLMGTNVKVFRKGI